MRFLKIAFVMLSCMITSQACAQTTTTYPLFVEEIDRMAQSQPEARRHVRIFFAKPMKTADIEKWSKQYDMDVLSVTGSAKDGEYNFTSSIENVDVYEGSLKQILTTIVRTEQRRGVESMRNSALKQAGNETLNEKQREYHNGYAEFLSTKINGLMSWKTTELLASYKQLSQMLQDRAVDRVILLTEKFTQAYEKLKREGKIKKDNTCLNHRRLGCSAKRKAQQPHKSNFRQALK
jgi:hypothetical protein